VTADSFADPEPDGPLSAGGDSPPPPDEAASAAKAVTTELDERLLRAMADLDNLRKRFQREVLREREAERYRVAAEWLPIIDDLDRALEHVDGDVEDGLAAGVRAVRDHAVDVLAGLGFPRFENVGERFDPARHEAVAAVEADVPPGTIVAVVRPGYGRPEVILRPAAVVVAKS
jgi:molecular chaperone GrpE